MAHIERLEKKGFLRRTPLHHRTLEVVEDSQGVKPQPTRRELARPKLSKLEQVQAQLDALRSTG
jgi:SOS-response transcriptional repressor LexA